MEKLRERLLQCSICLEEFKDPRILSCHHTLCFECISSIVGSSTWVRSFKCPQCRKDTPVPNGGIAYLPINFYIINLQDELDAAGVTRACNICERDWVISQFRCIDCDLNICRFCIHAHRLETHAEPPKILRIETIASSIQLASNQVCSDHADEMVQMFCTTCNEAICIQCHCSNHRQHNVVPINVKLQDSKQYLQSELDRLTSEKRNVQKTIEELNKIKEDVIAVFNTSQGLLDDVALQACQMIMKKKSDIEKELTNSEIKQLQSIEEAMNDFSAYMKKTNRGLAFLTELQDSDICLEVVDTYKYFSRMLNAARKKCTTKHIGLGHIQFSPSKYANIADINLGLGRKFYYMGQLGNLYGQSLCLSFNPKTMGIQKHTRSLSHLMGNLYIKSFIKFIVAFLMFQTIFYLGDVSGVFDQLALFIDTLYTYYLLITSELIK